MVAIALNNTTASKGLTAEFVLARRHSIDEGARPSVYVVGPLENKLSLWHNPKVGILPGIACNRCHLRFQRTSLGCLGSLC
jgi:hypothetical protein